MPLQLQILSMEGTLFEGPVESVQAPGIAGEMGILPGHAPLLTELNEGVLRVAEAGGTHAEFVIWGGFLHVLPDQVVVLADAGERDRDVDLARAEAARREAEERLVKAESGDQADLEAIRRSLRRNTLRVKLARRRRSAEDVSRPQREQRG